jgi:hypothetical protein
MPITAKHFQTQRRPITGKVSAFQDGSPHQKEVHYQGAKGMANLPWRWSIIWLFQSQPLQFYFDREAWDER